MARARSRSGPARAGGGGEQPQTLSSATPAPDSSGIILSRSSVKHARLRPGASGLLWAGISGRVAASSRLRPLDIGEAAVRPFDSITGPGAARLASAGAGRGETGKPGRAPGRDPGMRGYSALSRGVGVNSEPAFRRHAKLHGRVTASLAKLVQRVVGDVHLWAHISRLMSAPIQSSRRK